MSRFPSFLAAGSCFLLALGFSLGRLTCEPQGGRIPRPLSRSIHQKGQPGVADRAIVMIGQHEMEGLSREERTAILRLQMEQIMQAPGQLSRKMDLCVWVNQLDEKDLAALFEQVLPKEDGDMKAERRWEISEIRQYVLTRWARLNPANAMDASMKVFSPMPDAVLEVWIRTDATAVGDALLGLVAKGDWRPQDWEFANYVRELFGTDNVAATDVVMQLSESCDLDSRKLGMPAGRKSSIALRRWEGAGVFWLGLIRWAGMTPRNKCFETGGFRPRRKSRFWGSHVRISTIGRGS